MVCQFDCLSVCLSACLTDCLSDCLTVCLSDGLTACLPVRRPVCSVSDVCQSECLSTFQSVCHLPTDMYMYVHVCTCMYMCVWVHTCVCVCVCVCACVRVRGARHYNGARAISIDSVCNMIRAERATMKHVFLHYRSVISRL